jgi:hypothetical protein
MKEAVMGFCAGQWPRMRKPQGVAEHPTFKNASDEVLAVVYKKLADQTYAHYAN